MEQQQNQPDSFQLRVHPWLQECFGPEISADTIERNHRFLEEAIELVQACGCSKSEAHQLIDYVFGREIGEKRQEVGGVMVTLAALCLAQGMDMHECGEQELKRIWTVVEKIRAKQAAKPKHSPLPEHPPESPSSAPKSMDFAEVVNELRTHMDGNYWNILGFEPHPDLSEHQEQSTSMKTLPVEHVFQTGCDDFGFNGTILFPTNYSNGDGGNLYLKIGFSG